MFDMGPRAFGVYIWVSLVTMNKDQGMMGENTAARQPPLAHSHQLHHSVGPNPLLSQSTLFRGSRHNGSQTLDGKGQLLATEEVPGPSRRHSGAHNPSLLTDQNQPALAEEHSVTAEYLPGMCLCVLKPW